MSITVRCFNATSIYCLTASKGVWHDCSCWRKKEGIVSGLSAAERLWSHLQVVFSLTWSSTGGAVQLLSPQMQSRHYNPHAFCGFSLPFGLANLPSEITNIIRCIWISLCLSRGKSSAVLCHSAVGCNCPLKLTGFYSDGTSMPPHFTGCFYSHWFENSTLHSLL